MIPTGLTRPPVAVACYGCGHRWNTRAREGGTVRCPECSHPRRVPTGCRDRIDPGAPRVYREEAPPPKRPAPAREDGPGLLSSLASLFRPAAAPPGRVIGCLHCPARWRTTAAPGNSVRCPDCGKSRRIPTGPARRATATRTAPATAASRPALPSLAAPLITPARPALAPAGPRGPIDPQTLPLREQNRRDRACQTVRSLAAGTGLYAWYNQPPGACEALDSNQLPDEQRCPHRASHAVRYAQGGTDTHVYACTEHARRLAALADRAEYVTATVHPLRGR
ncbi:hypothetical protein [Streptomyces sp. NBC_01314]|uniref:hypothetical protein n=1 Tax=Streptomyces sp. NBC_01314 TaxID=2903821 RepID=UPI0030884712|nr:hypothetical protein OG622_50195 [Streptomyces sp. NBC_01314]